MNEFSLILLILSWHSGSVFVEDFSGIAEVRQVSQAREGRSENLFTSHDQTVFWSPALTKPSGLAGTQKQKLKLVLRVT